MLLFFFSQIHDQVTFWNWSESVLLPGLYNNTWYNDQKFGANEPYISDGKLSLVGLPRLRQARVRSGEQLRTRHRREINWMNFNELSLFSGKINETNLDSRRPLDELSSPECTGLKSKPAGSHQFIVYWTSRPLKLCGFGRIDSWNISKESVVNHYLEWNIDFPTKSW